MSPGAKGTVTQIFSQGYCVLESTGGIRFLDIETYWGCCVILGESSGWYLGSCYGPDTCVYDINDN